MRREQKSEKGKLGRKDCLYGRTVVGPVCIADVCSNAGAVRMTAAMSAGRRLCSDNAGKGLFTLRRHSYDNRQSSYDAPKNPYGDRQSSYGALQSTYDDRQSSYDTPQDPYGDRQGPYESRRRPDGGLSWLINRSNVFSSPGWRTNCPAKGFSAKPLTTTGEVATM